MTLPKHMPLLRRKRLVPIVIICCAWFCLDVVFARDSPAGEVHWQGQSIRVLLDELSADGWPLVYSSNLVGPDLVVTREPGQSDTLARLSEVLQAHGLTLEPLDGMYLVVRAGQPPESAGGSATLLVILANGDGLPAPGLVTIRGVPGLPTPVERTPGLVEYDHLAPGTYDIEISCPGYQTVRTTIQLDADQVRVLRTSLEPGPAELELLSVSASRYILFSNSQFFIDQRAIQALPDLGEDPVRSAQRLPGAAAGGLSSRSHFRGGENNENTIYLNGLKLLDPFHIRNYHNIFSTIDARAIAGVEAYTGGFPASYGDSMSGVLVLDSQQPDRPRRWELGLSVYNTSALFSGYNSSGTVDWLFSARRSNLGLFLNDDLGTPQYFDVFTELGINLSETTRLSVNALYADDQIVVITESDPAELERSDSSTRNLNLWLLLENEWTANLSSATILSWSQLENRHVAEVNDPDQMIATVLNDRNADVLGLRQDWEYDGFDPHLLRWGWGYSHQTAKYHFRSAAEYLSFYSNYPGLMNPSFTSVDAEPGGNGLSLFLSDRWSLTSSTALEMGLRWDRQTYTEPTFGDQFSPRVSLLHELNSSIDLRLTWGRYYQSQAIQEMQVEDGINHFFPPQRADHWITGLQYRSPGDYRVRFEAFVKDYDRLKPRFENLFDSLALIPEVEPDRVRLDPESARAGGLELTFEYRGQAEINWWVSVSWSRATDEINGSNERRSWDQEWAFQGGLIWERGLWEVGTAVNLHTGWPITGMTLGYDEAEDEYFPIPGPRNAQQLGTYFTLDFRISREIPVKTGRLSAFFEVSNLTNRQNPCCIDYDTDEDAAGEVVLDETIDDWLPIIPAIGIFWEF